MIILPLLLTLWMLLLSGGCYIQNILWHCEISIWILADLKQSKLIEAVFNVDLNCSIENVEIYKCSEKQAFISLNLIPDSKVKQYRTFI